jgi:hypothetical protein
MLDVPLPLQDIRAFLGPMVDKPHADMRRVENPKPRATIKKEQRQKEKDKRIKNIAVLDMETDRFNGETEARIFPFCAEIYSRNFDPIVIWNDDPDGFVAEVVAAIEGLPDEYTVFAHNGGKFDWQFLIRKMRGDVSFKGRSIMSAKIGNHTLRDSFHLLPEKLAAYRKDEFDYSKLDRDVRHLHRDEILSYQHHDCVYLFDLLHHFVNEHGLKISIGQAAMAAMSAAGYKVENLSEGTDAFFRNYYFGGRVECLTGKGVYESGDKPWKLYDVNSMYPAAMAQFKHPVGRAFECRGPYEEDGAPLTPGPNTIFLEVECNNHGALVKRGLDGETSAYNGHSTFRTTVHEYNVAIKYGLISDVRIKYLIDFTFISTFEKFVIPRYERRQTLKRQMRDMKIEGLAETEAFQLAKRNDLTEKYLLNNAYGKYAQNPRNYKESYITDHGWRPPNPMSYDKDGHPIFDKSVEAWLPVGCNDPRMGPLVYCAREDDMVPENQAIWDDLPAIQNKLLGYSIWERPTTKLRFRNVATAASITGAARAVLLEAICNAVDPIYCDTDSLICRELLNLDLDDSRLGAWDLEDEFSRVIIAGKKTYGCDRGAHLPKDKRYKMRSKGTQNVTWDDMEAILDDEIGSVLKTNPAPTLSRNGSQVYIKRTIRATAGAPNISLLETIKRRLAA